jgi:hypothetical protein
MREWAILLLAGLGLFLGCSGKATQAPPPRETVSGKVLAGSRPVAFVLVVFHPRDTADPNHYEAGTGKDGEFTLECPRGSYKVTITALPVGAGGDASGGNLSGADAGGLKQIPQQFRTKTETPFAADVSEGGRKDLVFNLN